MAYREGPPALTVITSIPGSVSERLAKVRVEEFVPPAERVTMAGLNTARDELDVNDTVPVKPLRLVRVKVEVTVPPA